MLRLAQQLCAQSRASGVLAAAHSRFFAESLPVPRPDEVKPFDPNGSLSQLEAYLDEDSKMLANIRKITSLLGEMDRRIQETAKNAPKEVNWSTFQEQTGYPPELVSTIKATYEAEKASVPKPKPHHEFVEFFKAKVQPEIVKEQEAIRASLKECDESLKDLKAMEDSLEDLTVDELLEKNPQYAQEIKDELEAGDFYKRG